MRYRISIVAAGLLALVVVGYAPHACADSSQSDGAATAQDVQRDTSRAIETLKSYTAAQKDEALASARAMLDRLEARIARLKDRLAEQKESMSEAAREQANETLKQLEAQRDRVEAAYRDLKNNSGDAWEDLKEGFADSYRRLSEAFGKALERF